MIRQATESDYIRLLRSIQCVNKEVPYITKQYLKNDIANGNCYVKVEKEKFVAICSLVYDSKREMYYGKRLTIPNKKNRGKGYAREMLEFLQNIVPDNLAITPWNDNFVIINLLIKLGFKFEYQFLDNYMLYLYRK